MRMKVAEPIAICSRSFSRNEYLRDKTLSLFSNVRFNDEGLKLEGESLVEFLKGMSGAVIALENVDDNLLNRLPNFKFIGKYGVGTNNIDFKALEKFKVHFSWEGGVNKRSVSELALSFMLDLSRSVTSHCNEIKNGEWNIQPGIQLTGKTVGVIGLGHIGKDLVPFLKVFNCRILVNDIAPDLDFIKKYDLEMVEKEEIYRSSDYITLHIPLDHSTRDLIGINELKQMKTTAFLINTSRGGIVNEDALVKAIGESEIAGAAFDVFVNEPNTTSGLHKFSNFICTPHIGGSSVEAIRAMGESALNGLYRLMSNPISLQS